MLHKAVPGAFPRFGRSLQSLQMLVDPSRSLHKEGALEPPIAALIPATGF
jgi:hypothetical protein